MIELVNLHLRALASAERVRFTDLVAQTSMDEQGQSVSRQAYFGPTKGTLETPVRRRADITGERAGPLIVEEPDITVVVPPWWSVRRDEQGNLVLARV